MAKNPASLFYWDDWDNDPELRACSLAAQGLWMRMLCVAARSPEPGVVLIGDAPGTPQALAPLLARMNGETPKRVMALIKELLSMGAAGLDSRGFVVCRRMVRAADVSAKRAEAANERWRKARQSASDLQCKQPSKPDASSRLQDSKTPEVVVVADARALVFAEMGKVWPDLERDMAFMSLSSSGGLIDSWIGDGAQLERDILPTIARLCRTRYGKGRGPPRYFTYFAQAVADAKATNEQDLPDGHAAPQRTARRQSADFKNGFAAMAHAGLSKPGGDGERAMDMEMPDPDQPRPARASRRMVPGA